MLHKVYAHRSKIIIAAPDYTLLPHRVMGMEISVDDALELINQLTKSILKVKRIKKEV